MNQTYYIKSADMDKNNEEDSKQIFLGLVEKIIYIINSDNVLHVTQRNNSK